MKQNYMLAKICVQKTISDYSRQLIHGGTYMAFDIYDTIRASDFIIGVSTQESFPAAELFAKELRLRTGTLPPICIGNDGCTALFCPQPDRYSGTLCAESQVCPPAYGPDGIYRSRGGKL